MKRRDYMACNRIVRYFFLSVFVLLVTTHCTPVITNLQTSKIPAGARILLCETVFSPPGSLNYETKTNSFENVELPGFEIIEPQKEYKGTYWNVKSVVKKLIANGETADMYFIVFSHKVIYKFLEPLKLEEIVGEKTASYILSEIVQDKNINNLKLGFIFEICRQNYECPPKQRVEFKGGGGIWQIGIPYQLYHELKKKYYSARPGEDLRKEYNSDITKIYLGKNISHPDPFGEYLFKNACIGNIYNVRQYNHQGKYIGNREFGITTCPECPGTPPMVGKKVCQNTDLIVHEIYNIQKEVLNVMLQKPILLVGGVCQDS